MFRPPIPGPLQGGRKCAVSKRTEDDKGFIETGQILPGWDQEVLLSVSVVEEMGKVVGMVPRHEVEVIANRLAELEDESNELQMKLDVLEQIKELEAVVA